MPGIRNKFFYQLLFATTQLVFPLLTYPYLARIIGAEGLGKVAFIEHTSGLIITLAAFGIPYFGVRETARLQHEERKRTQLFRQLFSIHLLCSVTGIFLFMAVVRADGDPIHPLLIILGCVNVVLPVFIADWYLQGMEDFRFISLRTVFLRLLGLIAIFVLVQQAEDYTVYYAIIIGVQVLVALLNLYRIGFGKPGVTRSINDTEVMKPLFHFFLTSSLISIYVFFDVIILGWMTTDDAVVGFYATALKIVKLSLLGLLALSTVLYPRISSLHAAGSRDEINRLVNISISFLITVSLPVCLAFLLLAEEIILVLTSVDFMPSVVLIRILAFLPLVISIGNLFFYQILAPVSREKEILLSVTIACITSIILLVTLTYFLREAGTAWAILLTETLVTILFGIYARRQVQLQFPWRIILQTVVSLIPFIVIALVCKYLLASPLFILFLSAIVGFAFYYMIQLNQFQNPAVVRSWNLLLFKKHAHG